MPAFPCSLFGNGCEEPLRHPAYANGGGVLLRELGATDIERIESVRAIGAALLIDGVVRSKRGGVIIENDRLVLVRLVVGAEVGNERRDFPTRTEQRSLKSLRSAHIAFKYSLLFPLSNTTKQK